LILFSSNATIVLNVLVV